MTASETSMGQYPSALDADSDAADLGQFCNTLKVLANPQRLRILRHLLRGEAAVGELESHLKLKQPNLSHELRKLRNAHIVKTRRQSKVIFYSIGNADIERMIKDILTLGENTQQADQNQPALLSKTLIEKLEANQPDPNRNNKFHFDQSREDCGYFPTVHHQ